MVLLHRKPELEEVASLLAFRDGAGKCRLRGGEEHDLWIGQNDSFKCPEMAGKVKRRKGIVADALAARTTERFLKTKRLYCTDPERPTELNAEQRRWSVTRDPQNLTLPVVQREISAVLI